MKNYTSKRGSALVMSLLFMTILIVLSFAVNAMLLNEIRSERNFLQGVKAYYSAEAGVEDGLLQVSLHDAGTPIDSKEGVDFVANAFAIALDAFDEEELSEVATNTYSYDIVSRGSYNPCEFESQSEENYSKLKSGESIMIPLTGNDYFQVEYYLVNTKYPFDPSFVMQNDSLRWKILGNRVNGEHVGKVEGISGYIPIYDVNHNTPSDPSTFGTDAEFPEFKNGKYYDILDGVVFDNPADAIYLDFNSFGNNFAEGGFHYVFHPTYPIQSFLLDHTNNYLMLTNFLNTIPATDSDVELIYNAEDYELYYRLHDARVGSEKTVACSSVKVSADGTSSDGGFVQSIDALRPIDQASPVTDFVWYQKD